MANFLSTPLGGGATKFEQGGISELYLLPFNKVRGKLTNVLGADSGTVVGVSAIALDGADKFVEMGFVEGSASYTDAYTPSNTKRFMEMALNFTIDASGTDAIDKAHSLLLQRKVVCLVKRKSQKWYLLGHTDGLAPAASNANSGAVRGDDSGMTFSFVGGNNGYAVEVTMTEEAISSIVTRLA